MLTCDFNITASADPTSQLYSLVGQRDIRIQSSIARATQRDSEDMKFIAVLGSIFLPASLVAVSLGVLGDDTNADHPPRQFSMSRILDLLRA